jgi:hypothetical protein
MREGIEGDDRFRMVEDEFLSVAQRFTVHLHAAEYKKQEKVATARNAETINSISRPVSGRMPDSTRKKIEGVARAKAQREAIEALVGKRDAEDSDDTIDLPYVGTTLHGLMDTPRGKSASLFKTGSPKTKTRAAAGFLKRSAQSSSNQHVAMQSPVPKSILNPRTFGTQSDASTESSDEDDDLDLPISAPKLKPVDKSSLNQPISNSMSDPITRQSIASSSTHLKSGAKNSSAETFSVSESATNKAPSKSTFIDEPVPLSSGRLARRLESRKLQQIRLGQMKEEQESPQTKRLDIVPTFL